MKKMMRTMVAGISCMMIMTLLLTMTLPVLAAEIPKTFVPTITASPSDGETVNLLSGEIYDFVTQYKTISSPKASVENYNASHGDNYAPCDVTISWESKGEPLYYTVKVATKADLSNAVSVVSFDKSISLGNLYSGQDYYYQVITKYEDRIVKSMIFDFHTADLPRTVQIEGVSNTRDMGGYYTADGKYQVKEGMIYRGGKLEDITEAGRTQMLDVLGIQTDLDVRGDASSGSPLGANVNYVNLKGPYYKALIMDSTYQKALANEIKVFADENNYPVYFHCSLGRDRTGTLAFLLNAMLGVGELDLFMDYELSWFATTAYLDTNIARNMIKGDFQAMYDYIDNYGAGTVAENAEQFMLDIGVTQTEINSIKSIMLRDVTHTNANETASLIVKAIETDAVHEEKGDESSDTVITKENGYVSKEFDCSYSAARHDEEYIYYGSSEVREWNEAEAAANNVPAGYTGTVLSVVGNIDKGVLLDFSENKIPASVVEEIVFRVYVGDDGNPDTSKPEVRIPRPHKIPDYWNMRYNISSQEGQWVDIVCEIDDTNKEYFSNEKGYLDKFELAIRALAQVPFYIDSVTVTIKADDGKAPVINYNGGAKIYRSEGSQFVLDISAFDTSENREIDLEYNWGGQNPYDAEEKLKKGTYQLTVSASDFYGNTSSKTFEVIVNEPDKEAPAILVNTDVVYTKIGTIPLTNMGITDSDKFDTEFTWSANAFDRCEKLVEGIHTFTVKATDLSNNIAEKNITFIVSANEETSTNVIDEEALRNTSDDSNDEDEEKGEQLTPENPKKEQTNTNNSEKTSPVTGDSINLWIYILESVVAIVVAIIIYKRRRASTR